MSDCIRQRSQGSWEISWPDSTMKSGRKSMTVRGTKKDAQRKLRDILRSIDEGKYTKPNKQTVADYLAFWLEQTDGTISISSKERYQKAIRTHINRDLGGFSLTALRPIDLQAIYKLWQEKGLSPRTIRLHHAILHRAFEAAVRWDLIPKNPAAYAEPPRADDNPRISSDEEIEKLRLAVKGTDYEGIVLLALYTGMRVGEICALRWEDVDLDEGTLSILGTAVRINGRMEVGSPKTDRARRMIFLPDDAVALLRSLPRRGDYVFPGRTTRPRSPSAVACALRRICQQAGTKVVMHGLRHAHASWLMRQGFNPKVVAERLGHSKVGITLDTYSHTTPGLHREAAAKVGKILAPRHGSP